MKEATGEANITVITIVLIAIVLAVGTVIVNSVLNNAKKSSCCTSVGGLWTQGYCWAPVCATEFGTNGKFSSTWNTGGKCYKVVYNDPNNDYAKNFTKCMDEK